MSLTKKRRKKKQLVFYNKGKVQSIDQWKWRQSVIVYNFCRRWQMEGQRSEQITYAYNKSQFKMQSIKIKHNGSKEVSKKRADLKKYDQLFNDQQERIDIQTSQTEDNLVEIVQNCFCKTVTKMKEEALQKATQMIRLLYEEKSQLENQLQSLREVLSLKDNTIMQLRELIQCQIEKQENCTLEGQLSPSYSRNKSISGTNELFFSFSQPKSKQLKRINTFDRSNMFETKPGSTMSKELQQWKTQEHIVQSLAQVISRQEIQISQFKELNNLVSTEIQISKELNKEYQLQNQQIEGEFEFYQSQEVIGSEGKSTTNYSQNKIQCTQDLINRYQTVICGFREHSAFLRSCLCEATSYISKMGMFWSSISCESSNNLFKLCNILNDLKSYDSPIAKTKQQNRQLRLIIDELLQNIEVIKANIKK